MTSSGRRMVLAVALTATAAGGVLWWFVGVPLGGSDVGGGVASFASADVGGKDVAGVSLAKERKSMSDRQPLRPMRSLPGGRGRKNVGPLLRGERPSLPPEEKLAPEAQELVDTIEKAYDSDDLKSVLALAGRAHESKFKAVREQMVWALGWFGKAALPELIPFMADPDDEVASDALSAFNDAIQEIDEEKERIKTVELVMMKVTSAEILEDVAMEYIGVDDRLAVESLARVIEGASETGRRQARETYESITGEAYTTLEAARNWLETYAP